MSEETSLAHSSTTALFEQYVGACVKQSVSDVAGLRLHSAWAGRTLSKHERDGLFSQQPPVPHIPYRLYRACVEIVERHGCVRCWLQRHCCICRQVSTPVLPPSPIRIVLLLHHLEYGRASNTGKLLMTADGSTGAPPLSSSITFHSSSPDSDPVLAPALSFSSDGVLMLIAGLPAHDAELKRMCDEDEEGKKTFVLFPSRDALDIDEWKERVSASAPSPFSSSSPSFPSTPLTMIVVDGTFSQASSLVKAIPPHISRVKLQLEQPNPSYSAYVTAVQQRVSHHQHHTTDEDDVHRRAKQWTSVAAATSPSTSSFTSPSFFTALRRQPQPDRMSTIEAVALALQSLDGEFRAALFDRLLVQVDALRLQAGLYQVYGTQGKEQLERMKRGRKELYAEEAQTANAKEKEDRSTRGESGRRAHVCRAFNKVQGCDKGADCPFPHRCGRCDQPDHPFHLCRPEG